MKFEALFDVEEHCTELGDRVPQSLLVLAVTMEEALETTEHSNTVPTCA